MFDRSFSANFSILCITVLIVGPILELAIVTHPLVNQLSKFSESLGKSLVMNKTELWYILWR